jgi:hypothetical protein
MIENSEDQWWNDEENAPSKKRGGRHISDSEFFQIEISKIEEALHNLSQFLKRYVEE